MMLLNSTMNNSMSNKNSKIAASYFVHFPESAPLAVSSWGWHWFPFLHIA